MVCSYNMDRSNSKVDYAYECFYRVKELTVVLAEVESYKESKALINFNAFFCKL